MMKPNGEEREVGEETRILVIEGDPDVRFLLRETFKTAGYDIQAVESALEGLEAMRGERFHLVIVNLRMPEMGGEETVREIRKIDPQVPVVVITGSPEWLTEELKSRIQGWVFKPFSLQELASLVRGLLKAKKGSNCDHRTTDCATGERKI